MLIKKPILMICAIIISLIMVRLGFWQLDRAEQKRQILTQSINLSQQPAVSVQSLLPLLEENLSALRFRQVTAKGQYLGEKSILIDNQVFETRVGYSLLTPFKLAGSDLVVLVDRGWLPVGQSREQLPNFDTPLGERSLTGRLNFPYAQPPLWNDKYDVSNGMVWQYLPIEQFHQQTALDVVPLVLELAPSEVTDGVDSIATINWQSIGDEWVFKHQAYALQWFSMAAVFFVACLILLLRSIRKEARIKCEQT